MYNGRTMDFHSLGKWLMGAGLLLVMVGVVFVFLPRLPFLGRLPGDLLVKKGHFTFYFPLTTSILVSLILTLLLYLFRK